MIPMAKARSSRSPLLNQFSEGQPRALFAPCMRRSFAGRQPWGNPRPVTFAGSQPVTDSRNGWFWEVTAVSGTRRTREDSRGHDELGD